MIYSERIIKTIPQLFDRKWPNAGWHVVKNNQFIIDILKDPTGVGRILYYHILNYAGSALVVLR